MAIKDQGWASAGVQAQPMVQTKVFPLRGVQANLWIHTVPPETHCDVSLLAAHATTEQRKSKLKYPWKHTEILFKVSEHHRDGAVHTFLRLANVPQDTSSCCFVPYLTNP